MLQNLFSTRQFRLTKWRFLVHSTTRNAPFIHSSHDSILELCMNIVKRTRKLLHQVSFPFRHGSYRYLKRCIIIPKCQQKRFCKCFQRGKFIVIKVSEYDQEMHNHILQSNPNYRTEETQYTNSYMPSRGKLK